MLTLLEQLFLKKQNPPVFSVSSVAKNLKNKKSQQTDRGVVYEHIKVTPGAIEVCGEHIMARGGPLQLHTDFFGADEAVTNYAPGKNSWTATLINSGANISEAWEKRQQIIKNIRDKLNLKIFKDCP